MDEGGWTWRAGILVLATAALGALARLPWPANAPALPCAPQTIRWVDAGFLLLATCDAAAGVGVRPPAGQTLALGGRLDLNEATEAELSAVPGVGRTLAAAIVRAREARGGFRAWDELDEVVGVGPSKLESMRRSCSLQTSTR